MSNVKCQMSNVKCQMSNEGSGLRHLHWMQVGLPRPKDDFIDLRFRQRI
jgi:hypothetical protein